jgi:NAD(P)-dependent dehydrogenase (short-subunit alcohol dehydrogenase family)
LLSGRTRATLDETAAAIGERAIVQIADVSNEMSVLALRDATLAACGKIDVLVLTHGLLEHDLHGKHLLDRTPLGRFTTPLDMAGGVVFLALPAMHPRS